MFSDKVCMCVCYVSVSTILERMGVFLMYPYVQYMQCRLSNCFKLDYLCNCLCNCIVYNFIRLIRDCTREAEHVQTSLSIE